jgi:hypothetical protein
MRKIDILILTETHTKQIFYEGKYFTTKNEEQAASGVAILFLNETFYRDESKIVVEGRNIDFRIRINQKLIKMKAIYAPPEKRERTKFFQNIEGESEEADILVGDWNAITEQTQETLQEKEGRTRN